MLENFDKATVEEEEKEEARSWGVNAGQCTSGTIDGQQVKEANIDWESDSWRTPLCL